MSADLTIMGVQYGCFSFRSAATPDTCGVAMLVPAIASEQAEAMAV